MLFRSEYLTQPAYHADAKRRLDRLGFLMYAGPRSLDDLRAPEFIADAVAKAGSKDPAATAAQKASPTRR